MNVLVIGSSTIDIFLEIEDKNHIDFIQNKIQLQLGDKIPMNIKGLTIGGDGANVAAGISYLGNNTKFYTYLGTDIFSREIEETIHHEGIKLLVDKTEGGKSSMSLIYDFKNDRIIFSHHEVRNHTFNFKEDEMPNFVYLASIGDYWQNAYKLILDFVKCNNIPLAITPGTHQLEAPSQIMPELIKISKIILINYEEALKMLSWNNTKTNDVKSTLLEIKKLGPEIVSVTDGAKGAYAIDQDNNFYKIGTYGDSVIEKTGAGDAYASGFISAHLNNLSVQECMKWGSINSHSVMQKTGAHNGLLRKEEMEQTIKENPDFKAEILE